MLWQELILLWNRCRKLLILCRILLKLRLILAVFYEILEFVIHRPSV